MNRNDTIKLLAVSGISILLGVLTILVVYFVTSRQAPSAPPSKPHAAGACFVEFVFPSPTITPSVTPTITPGPSATPTLSPTPTPTGSLTPTNTPTVTPTPTTPAGCYSTCTTNADCTNSMVCQSISGVSRCVNSSCPYNSDCVCGQTPTNTPTLIPTQQVVSQTIPSPAPTIVVLKEAGISGPAWTAFGGGSLLVLLGVLFFAL